MGAQARPGTLVWIGVRPARNAPLVARETVRLQAHSGVEGDHYETHHDGARQATFIAAEDIDAVASFLGRSDVHPDLLRRNFVTRGINLLALKGRRFRMGTAVFETSGECAPCSRMETNLGQGGFNAMRGRGGITARIVEGGAVQIGDAIERLDDPGT